MFYGGDAKGVAVVMEAHAIVADAQPEAQAVLMFWRRFHIAFRRFLEIAGQRGAGCGEQMGLIDRAEVEALAWIGPENVLAHAYRPVL